MVPVFSSLPQAAACGPFLPPRRPSCKPSRVAGSRRCRFTAAAASQPPSEGWAAETDNFESVSLPENFCIIESRDTVQDFAALALDEIQDGIDVRRNRVFLLMEEVRRLRIQEKLKCGAATEEDVSKQEFNSALPLLPPLSETSIKDYYIAFTILVCALIAFGGYFAPMAEVKLGLGGTSYAEWISGRGLPSQLGEVDPIVASFTGGAVGVLSMLLLVEVNNVKKQHKARCVYCSGTGYLPCAQCGSRGRVLVSKEGVSAFQNAGMCVPCSGTGKVMCTSCLCTGKAMATVHDPRIDPFGDGAPFV